LTLKFYAENVQASLAGSLRSFTDNYTAGTYLWATLYVRTY